VLVGRRLRAPGAIIALVWGKFSAQVHIASDSRMTGPPGLLAASTDDAAQLRRGPGSA
jgi:hypothetical protein